VRPALLFLLVISGCGAVEARLRFVSSYATQASWSFVIDDRARGAEVLIDGRYREDGCDRAGQQIRCELRGMFPGGHTLEVRLPAAVMKRTVLIGSPWPERPALVSVRDPDEAAAAAKAGADGVVVEASALEPWELVDAAHKQGARALVRDVSLIESAGADGVIGGELPLEIRRRFPDARAYVVDDAATQAVRQFAAGGDATAMKAAMEHAAGLVVSSGLPGDAAALAADKGAIVDAAALPMLRGRHKHPALREGKARDWKLDGPRYGVTLVSGNDAATLLVNAGGEPWRVEPALPTSPLDLLGGKVDGGAITVAPHDVALLVRLPEKDKTRY
jgi:hypothetical protein